MKKTLTTPTIQVNGEPVQIVPNSFSYTEGFGEQTLRVQSAGGAAVEAVFTDNAEMKMSDIKFSMFGTADNIALSRLWKSNGNANTLQATDDNGFARSFAGAALTANYEVGLGADTTIDLEFMSEPAV